MAIRTGLIDSYNTFNINRKLIDDIDSKIFLGDDNNIFRGRKCYI